MNPQLPPPPSVLSPPASPGDSSLSNLQQKRNALTEALVESLTPEKVKAVLGSLLNTALGANGPSGIVAAAKLYLQYAVGSAEHLAGGEKPPSVFDLTAADLAVLQKVAARHGKGLSNVRVVKSVPNIGGADVIETEKPSEEIGGGKGESERSTQAAE
jgi:hypothetical protein